MSSVYDICGVHKVGCIPEKAKTLIDDGVMDPERMSLRSLISSLCFEGTRPDACEKCMLCGYGRRVAKLRKDPKTKEKIESMMFKRKVRCDV